jgi:hypothetical protein
MTTDSDPRTRIVLSWLREDAHEHTERMLLRALDEVDTTPQRRSWWPAWRSNRMNIVTKVAVAAAAVLVVAFAGDQLLPRTGGIGGQPTTAPTSTPSPTPALLAKGSFGMLQEASVELDATGRGSNVTGVWTFNDAGPRFTADLECERTTPGGLIVIGGTVTESTLTMASLAPQGNRVAIVIQRGPPMQALPHFEDHPPAATCLAFLESVTDAGAADALVPIRGTIELGP